MTASTKIGRFRLVEVSGTGTFATVHRAEDDRLGDTVALKVLAENHSLDAEIRERFLGEGRALRRIDSDHVVAVHDLGETDRQQPYLVMEYADRGTLADRVAARRRDGWSPSAEDVRTVATSLARAVAAIHRADIVHRDLSPNNVLLRSRPSSDGAVEGGHMADLGQGADDGRHVAGGTRLVAADERLVLADLGLCKDLARHSGLTAAGGTDGFRPPEQRGTHGYVSPAADLWSLSALLAWLVTGRTPTEDEDVASDVAAAGLPAALGVALVRGLSDEPTERPADAAEWLAGVEMALAAPPAVDAAASAEGPPTASETPDASPPRARWIRPAVALGLVALGAAIVLVLTYESGSEMTELAGGDVLVAQEADGTSIALAGPDEVTVGETATFVADLVGTDAWAWIAPDGTIVTNEPRLSFSTTSPGRARVHLVAPTPSGELLRVSHEVSVVDD